MGLLSFVQDIVNRLITAHCSLVVSEGRLWGWMPFGGGGGGGGRVAYTQASLTWNYIMYGFSPRLIKSNLINR